MKNIHPDTMKEFDEKFGYTDTLETGESVRRIKGILLVSTVTDWIDTRLIEKKVVEEEIEKLKGATRGVGVDSLIVIKHRVEALQSLLNK